MSAESGPTPEEMGIETIGPWNENVKLSTELAEQDKIQWEKPQIIFMIGLPRSGKSTVGTVMEMDMAAEGLPAMYMGSDLVRNELEVEIEKDLEEKGLTRGTEEFANAKAAELYSPENRQRVYDQLYAAAGAHVREENGIVIVDATHITADKRREAYDKVMQAYHADGNQNMVRATFIEVENDHENAVRIFEQDNERIEAARKGLVPDEAKVDKPVKPHYLQFDKSQATLSIRERDAALYQPPQEIRHIKIINNFDNVDDLIAHVRNDVLAKKPESIDTLWDID